MKKRIPIIIGILLICLAVWVLITPTKTVRLFIERLDNLGYDLQLRTRVLTEHAKPANSVAIVDINDRSLKAEGRWPWSRSKLGLLVDKLEGSGAAVIAFDIFFSEKESNIAEQIQQELQQKKLLNPNLALVLKKSEPFFAEDSLFAKSLAQSPSVLAFSFLFEEQTQNSLPAPSLILTAEDQRQLNLYRAKGYIGNIPILQQEAKIGGFINIFPDSDGIIRRAPLLMEYKNGVYPALSLQAILTFLNEKIILLTPTYGQTKKLEGIQLGSFTIPTDDKGQVLIPFIGKSYTFPYYAATDVLNDRVAKNAFEGKIVFIGTSATGLSDLKATAIQNPFPGVEVQATLVNGILQQNFSYIPAWTLGANIMLVVLLGFIAACLFPYLGPRTLSFIIIVLPPTLLFINNWLWERTGLILSFLVPVILVLVIAIFNIIYGYLFETRRRERLKEMFGQYVPEKHIDEMLRTNSDFGLHGQDREMSVMFADIRNFTTISEGMSASELVDMLNTFFTPMTEIIFKHRGTIDKYIGDLIMAFWGAPLKDKNHARHAIQSALEMQARIKTMRELIAAHQWPDIHMGIGINSGMMSVGDMGSHFRRNYTVLGDAVNLASRVENLTKFYGVDIIVTKNARLHQSHFIFRKLDKVRVKGKQQGIEIYEVIGTKDTLTAQLAQELELYHQALDFYFSQQWDEAYALMKELNKTYPDKRIYQLYLERITEFKTHSLPTDWDGVYVHLSK